MIIDLYNELGLFSFLTINLEYNLIVFQYNVDQAIPHNILNQI